MAFLPSSPAAATTAALDSPPLVANTFGHRYRPTPLPTPSLESRQPSTPSSPSLSCSSSTRRTTAAADPGAVREMQKLVRQLTGTDFQSGGGVRGGAATQERDSSATTCTNGGGSDVADDKASSKQQSQQQPSCKAGRRHQRSWQASATMSTVTSPVGVVNSAASQQHQRPSSPTVPPTSNAAVAAAMERKQAKSARRRQAEANAKLSTEHEIARAKHLSATVENKLGSEPQADRVEEPEKRYSQEMQRHLLGQMVAMLESFNLSGQQQLRASR